MENPCLVLIFECLMILRISQKLSKLPKDEKYKVFSDFYLVYVPLSLEILPPVFASDDNYM